MLESLETMAERLNLEISVDNLHLETFSADYDNSQVLEVPVGTPLLRVQRVMREESRPVAYLLDTLPEDVPQA